MQPGVKETCEGCGEYLHCCLNCKFYDTTKPCDCYIPNIDPVKDKEKFNFCDEFAFRDADESVGQEDSGRGDFDALFSEKAEEDSKPKSFDDLFSE